MSVASRGRGRVSVTAHPCGAGGPRGFPDAESKPLQACAARATASRRARSGVPGAQLSAGAWADEVCGEGGGEEGREGDWWGARRVRGLCGCRERSFRGWDLVTTPRGSCVGCRGRGGRERRCLAADRVQGALPRS